MTWYGKHRTPPEILRYGMDPSSPSTNEWIARAHYKKLVQQFDEWKLYKAERPEKEWQNFKEGDRIMNTPYYTEAIEAVFDHSHGTLTVAVLYDPGSRLHYVSTVPRTGRRGGKASEIRRDGQQNAPLWHAAASSGSRANEVGAMNNLGYHAEDGACYLFENSMGNGAGNGGYYRQGSAMGAWHGKSNYPAVQQNGLRTTADPEGNRIDLCTNGYPLRGTRGCQTVASMLRVAFNGDGRNRPGQYQLQTNPCSRDGRSVYIRGREVACPLNLKPSPTPNTGVAAKAITTGVLKASRASKGFGQKSAAPNSVTSGAPKVSRGHIYSSYSNGIHAC